MRERRYFSVSAPWACGRFFRTPARLKTDVPLPAPDCSRERELSRSVYSLRKCSRKRRVTLPDEGKVFWRRFTALFFGGNLSSLRWLTSKPSSTLSLPFLCSCDFGLRSIALAWLVRPAEASNHRQNKIIARMLSPCLPVAND
eukprot:371168-Rhodomonas_salina.3